jgi:cell division septum initiation protein DivIVA
VASQPTREDLHAQIADLRAKRAASSDKAENDRMLAKIRELEDQVTQMDLQAGRDALARVNDAAAKADQAATAQPLDALSALGRQAGKLNEPKPKK